MGWGFADPSTLAAGGHFLGADLHDTLGHGVRECPVAQMLHRRPVFLEVVNIEQSQPPPSA
jgi:hypothetical protein